MHAHGYAAIAADAPLVPHEFERREIGPRDVAIAIEFCGICHSDLHIARNEWGFTQYPVVLGHEIIGSVTAVGPEVTGFAPGDRVGVGCMVDSCQTCAPCQGGLEQYCSVGYTATAGGPDGAGGVTHGGFSNVILVREEFVLRVPDGLNAAAAAPLLCAGVTTYSPLKRWGAGPGNTVGVVGLGGLGHIAIRLAKAMGAKVVAITTSPEKVEAARALGADDVIVGTTMDDFGNHAGRLDLILNTASAATDLNPYVSLLGLDGTMVMLGAGSGPGTPLITWQLESQRRSVAGSVIGGIGETQEMLDFCAEHGIGCEIEIVQPGEINAAFERLDRGDVKFRFVVDLRNEARA